MNPSSHSRAAALPECLIPYPPVVEEQIHKRFSGQSLTGISEGVDYQLTSGGKRIRPALTLWLSERLGAGPSEALPFALAVELLHNVFLIQDDIQDGDTFRRGRPTLWRRIGVDRALNVADFLLAEAYALIGETARDDGCRTELFRVFTETFRRTVEGQALDLEWRARSDFGLARYDELVRKKTGRYLAVNWVGAALIAGHSRDEAARLWEVGDQLGPAFQICDDLLDLTPAKGRGGEIGCDIREGKPSALFALAMESSLSDDEKGRLVEVLGQSRDDTDDVSVQWVMEAYRRSGALDEAILQARQRAEAGIAAFSALPFVPPTAAAEFRAVAEFIVERKA